MNMIKLNTLAIILIIIGIAFVILMFFNPISDIALAIAGAGFILSGFIQFGQSRSSEQNQKRFEEIMNKLNQIQHELEKEEKFGGGGVAIADVIASGLKYYSEYMNKPKKEESHD